MSWLHVVGVIGIWETVHGLLDGVFDARPWSGWETLVRGWVILGVYGLAAFIKAARRACGCRKEREDAVGHV